MTDRDPTGTDPATGSVPRRARRRASRPAGPPVDRPATAAPTLAASTGPAGDRSTPPPAAEVSTASAVDPEPAVRTKPGRRRTRERAPRTEPQQSPTARTDRRDTAPATAIDEAAAREQNTRVDKRRRAENERSDRLARTLQTHRKTQVPSDIALRAREYAQPDAEDLRLAEAEVVLVRRNYVPPAPLDDNRPGAGRGARQRRRT